MGKFIGSTSTPMRRAEGHRVDIPSNILEHVPWTDDIPSQRMKVCMTLPLFLFLIRPNRLLFACLIYKMALVSSFFFVVVFHTLGIRMDNTCIVLCACTYIHRRAFFFLKFWKL